MTRMRGAICRETIGPDGVHVTDDLPVPPIGAGQVRVRVAFAALNFMDTLVITGRYQYKPPLPFVPGHDASGTVVEIGAGVTGLQPGDRVSVGATTGAFAQQIVVPAQRVVRLPDGVDLRQGAAYRASHGSALYALRHRAALRAGETVVVTGAGGGVGLAALQIARVLGARAIGVVRSADKAEAVAAAGAQPLVCADAEQLADAIRAVSPRGHDVALDTVGGPGQLALVRSAAWGARILVVGFAAGIPQLPANRLLLQGCSLVGVNYGAGQDREPEVAAAVHASLLDWMAQGRVVPHIGAEFALDDVRSALARLACGGAVGKLLLRLQD